MSASSGNSGVTQQLSVALERLKKCRTSWKDYLEASEGVLIEIAKLEHVAFGATDEAALLYQKLFQEFVYAEKCAELRRPAYVGSMTSQTSNY